MTPLSERKHPEDPSDERAATLAGEPAPRSRISVLGVEVDALTERDLLGLILRSAQSAENRVITYATAHTLVQCHRDPKFLETIRGADTCYADGMGVVLAGRLTSGSELQKVTANDFFPALMAACHRRGMRVALIGGQEDVAKRARDRTLAELGASREPAAHWCRTYSGFFDEATGQRMLSELEHWAPHLALVGMGQPRQEAWSLSVRTRLPSTTFHCVGGLFDVYSGRIGSPPAWLRKAGGEWMFRLWDQPRLTWKRYLLGLPELAWLVLRDVRKQVLSGRSNRGAGDRM